MDSNWLLDDGTVLDQLSDSISGVGLSDFGGFGRIHPDLSLTNTDNRSGKSLLSSQVSPVFNTKYNLMYLKIVSK